MNLNNTRVLKTMTVPRGQKKSKTIASILRIMLVILGSQPRCFLKDPQELATQNIKTSST